jgi:pimeloyl-ACP methyl ester carboxylesterase
MPNARKVVIAGAGHMSNMEQPDAFNQVVMNFLRE